MIVKFGIDLGTTNSCIAFHDGKSAKIMPLKDGYYTLPSCVMYDKGRIIVGREAYSNRYKTKQVVYSAKRDIGSDRVYEIDDGRKTFKVTPVQVSAEILKELKKQAEIKFQSPIEAAVITVPAYFNDRQKRDTLAAGELAGFKTVRLLPEPSAAAIAYTEKVKEPEHVVVYDLGGGTFDVSLLNIVPPVNTAGGLFKNFAEGAKSVATVEVVAIEGNNRLGGDDFDAALYKELCKEMNVLAKESYGASQRFSIDKQLPKSTKERLLLHLEECKKSFGENRLTFGVPVRFDLGSKKFNEIFHLDKMVFNKCFYKIFETTIQSFGKVLDSTSKPVSKIILIGGSTKYAPLKGMLEEIYPNIDIYSNISPDYSVAIGAAIVAASDENMAAVKLLDVVPQNIGIMVEKREMGIQQSDVFQPIIPKSAPIPAVYHTTVETEFPGQVQASLDVYEGDAMVASENALLGRLIICGIKPKRDKSTPIFVTLTVNVNGILSITAQFDGKQESLELVNVVESTDRNNSCFEHRLLFKKYSRFEAVLDDFELNDEEQALRAHQASVIGQTKVLSDDYIAMVRKYQAKKRFAEEAQREAFMNAGA